MATEPFSVEQFEDKGLSHFSYAVLSQGQVALIDPARDPQPYYGFAEAHNARIVAVIETHPHADFVSSHLEIHRKTGAVIYASQHLGADYPHQTFDEGQALTLGTVTLRALNTPGHSPDSLSVVLQHQGRDRMVFTGDTLFIGDVGRPDLRETVGNQTAKREDLARQMYRSTRGKLMQLAGDVVVFPAHGAGTLCGKALKAASQSTIGAEKAGNPALQPMDEDAFVRFLTADQPFVPRYFGYNVMLNKKGAAGFADSLAKVPRLPAVKTVWDTDGLDRTTAIIDTRPQETYKRGHLANSINLMDGGKFETWLGSILAPEEKFYLVAGNEETLRQVMAKTAKIGYETNIAAAFVLAGHAELRDAPLDLDKFKADPDGFTIVDIRNDSEVREGKVFENALAIQLSDLRGNAHRIPTGKPVVVHCAGGYRSAAGSSLLGNLLPVQVYDLGEAIAGFKPVETH